jgi:hypothetical protein
MGKQEKQVSWAEAAQNIVIKAMSNGWLAVLLIPAFFVLIFWLVPDKDKKELLENIIEKHFVAWGGWVTSGCTIIGWLFHVKWVRLKYDNELTRQAEQKTELQKKLTSNGEIKSSKR